MLLQLKKRTITIFLLCGLTKTRQIFDSVLKIPQMSKTMKIFHINYIKVFIFPGCINGRKINNKADIAFFFPSQFGMFMIIYLVSFLDENKIPFFQLCKYFEKQTSSFHESCFSLKKRKKGKLIMKLMHMTSSPNYTQNVRTGYKTPFTQKPSKQKGTQIDLNGKPNNHFWNILL